MPSARPWSWSATSRPQARGEADRRARKIIAIAMQRVASELTTESTVTTVTLPNEDMKGRIIGREGRNIRAFEAATGTNLIIDDTPEAVVLSCFDPIRREMARHHPREADRRRPHPAGAHRGDAREVQGEVEHEIVRPASGRSSKSGSRTCTLSSSGCSAASSSGLRTARSPPARRRGESHAGMVASELGTNVTLAKRCTLLHDIGKAVTHEVEGSHALHRGRDRQATRRDARGLSRDRGAPRRGRAAHDRGRHHPDGGRHLRRTSGGPARDARDLRQTARAPRADRHGVRRRREGLRDAGRPRE